MANVIQVLRGQAQVGAQGVALIVAAAFFMQNLDSAIINTSLPQMARSFGVPTVDVSLGVTAYILAVAAFVPLSGWISDRFGAKRVFAAAIVVFTLASVACAAANGLWAFVAARLAQGLGGALMTPVGRVVVLRTAAKHELLQATALITWPALIAPVIAPVLGGAITTWFDWRWNFLLNLPLGLAGVALVLAFVPDQREDTRRPLDLPGAVLTSASLILMIYSLEQFSRGTGWLLAAALLAAGAALGVGALAWFKKTPHPLLDTGALAIKTFAISTLDAGTFVRVAISSTPFMLPLMLQVIWKLNPLQAGGVVLVYFLGNLAMKTVTTPTLRRWGFRTVLAVNGLLVAISIVACGFLTARTGIWVTDAVMFFAGATRSMQFTALNTLSFADIPAEHRTSSSTLSSMMQQVSMALGVAAAALGLHLAEASRGANTLSASDFQIAFFAAGACALIGAMLMLRLHPDAGHEVSGRAPKT
ncbi:MAG TPA: MFS transporter [Caulobacteraceae bacterium]|jgi:EmrB/QacA subfamily drug resistance transporter